MFPSRIATLSGDVFRNEYSLEFDGTNDYVEVGDVGSIKSLVFWFKPASEITSSSSARSLFAFRDDASNKYYGIQTGASTGVVTGEVLGILPDGSSRTATNTTLNAGQWYHFAIVWNSSSNYFDIYTDGTLTTDLSAGTHSLANWTEFRIGRDFGTYGPTNCNIDEVAIWDTALSAGQVRELYNNRDSFNAKNIALSNLKGYWRMGDGVLDDRRTNGIVADEATPTSTQMFTNPDFTDNITGWGGTNNCSVAYSSGSLRQTSSSAANSYFEPSSSGFSATTGAIRIEAKCTIISGTQTPRFEIRDGANANWVYNTGTTVGAVTTFDYYMAGANDEGNVHIQLRGSNSGVADWDYIKMTKYGGNAGLMVSFDGTDFKTDTH